MINKSLWDKVQDVQAIDGRKLNMSRKINITIAYAPHAERPEEKKHKLYKSLYDNTMLEKRNEINIVAGDFNARLVKPQK